MNDSQIEEMGLDLGVVEQHAERIKKVVAGTIESPKFEVLDTCRVSNRRILQIPPSFECNINQDFKDYVSFSRCRCHRDTLGPKICLSLFRTKILKLLKKNISGCINQEFCCRSL